MFFSIVTIKTVFYKFVIRMSGNPPANLLNALQEFSFSQSSDGAELSATRGNGSNIELQVPNASTNEYGIVKLIDEASDSTNNPPTARFVKDNTLVRHANEKINILDGDNIDFSQSSSSHFLIGNLLFAYGIVRTTDSSADSRDDSTSEVAQFSKSFSRIFTAQATARTTSDYSTSKVYVDADEIRVYGNRNGAFPAYYLAIGEPQD